MIENKTKKSSSNTSIGFGNENVANNQIPAVEGPLPYGNYLYDSAGFAIKCEHKKMPIMKVEKGNGFWLPYIQLSPEQKWKQSSELMSQLFLNDLNIHKFENKLEKIVLSSISRLQLPQGEFVTRNIYFAHWKTSAFVVDCCRNTSRIEWQPIVNIIEGKVDKLWGPEVGNVAKDLNKFEEKLTKKIELFEYTSNNVFKYLLSEEDLKKLDKTDSSVALFAELLKNTCYREKEILKIYSDFIQHCYPSLYMNFISFRDYMHKIDWNKANENILKNTFQAMNYGKSKYLGFHEFLLGLAVLEPKCPHGLARSAPIFRYYDSNRDGFLEKSDLCNLIRDMRKIENKPIDEHSVNQHFDDLIKIPDFANNNRVSFDSFSSSIGSLKFRGTSILFRSHKSLLELISTKNLYEFIGQHNTINAPFGLNMAGICPNCRPKKYKLAIHSVKVVPGGRLVDPKSILFTDGKDIELKLEDEFTEMNRKHSMEMVFKDKSTPNCVLEIIRELAEVLRNETNIAAKEEFKQNLFTRLTVPIINNLCQEVTQIFRAEPRVIKVNSPCFVMGDIHGNLLDLLAFKNQMWRMAPQSNVDNVLFTGDYVDRGDYGIEVVLYLFAMKILAPNKFFLLRGNHEIRSIQKTFTFERECIEKFRIDGNEVFEIINSAFDVMPIVCLVDETIFCAHGGIPYSVSKIEDLLKIPTPLREPEKQSPAAWEILWSDPISEEEFKQMKEFMHLKDETGFISNTKRSTAFFFSEKSVNAFLKTNQLSHVIRAHEFQQEGYRFHHKGKVITIFSSSRYCGSNNRAASAFIDGNGRQGVIKILFLDT